MFVIKRGICTNKGDNSKFVFARIMRLFGLKILSETRVFFDTPNITKHIYLDITSLLKTLWEKEKSLITSNFSFSHSVFYSFGELSAIFIKLKIFICKLFEFGIV